MYLAPKNTAKIDIYKIYPMAWGPTDIFCFCLLRSVVPLQASAYSIEGAGICKKT
jgi:hypothetical protein